MNVAIVGEAYSFEEEKAGRSFIGASGWLLDQLLSSVGIARRDCLVTNVFNLRPARNDVESLCGKQSEGFGPALKRGKYVRREYAPEIERLYNEIRTSDPNIIVALGTTAAWALLHSSGIRSIRGALAVTPDAVSSRLGRPYKVLPTYHPAAVLRQWNLRPIVTADLEKAKRQSDDPIFRRPSRRIWLRPTLEDLARYEQDEIRGATILSADIETKQDQITCIGFAPRADSAIVIPFFSQPGVSYWPTKGEEVAAWEYVRRWLRDYPTVFQNGLYDINFLWSRYGIPVPRAEEDTMLLHHAMQPEIEKGLGFLASLYTDEPSWKHMRKGMKHD